MIATTISQSKELVRLGLDLATADMYYDNLAYDDLRIGNTSMRDTTPAWSFYALLEVMRQANAVTTLQVTSLSTFMRCKDMGFIWQNDVHINDPLTATYEMVCWLLEQGLIKKGDNNE